MVHDPSPAKVILAAVELAARAEIDDLLGLTTRHQTILKKELLLRILLTFLPETTSPVLYVALLQKVVEGDLGCDDTTVPHWLPPSIETLSEDQARKKVCKLNLAPLPLSNDLSADPFTEFLLRRARALDEEAGMLSQIPDLLQPFVGHSEVIHSWLTTTIIPLVRRSTEYYITSDHCTLASFEKLPDRTAVEYLLSETPLSIETHGNVGKDLRGLLSPWLYDSRRWHSSQANPSSHSPLQCLGWESAREWLIQQVEQDWRFGVAAADQWNGPRDVDFGDFQDPPTSQEQLCYFDATYCRTLIAAAYRISDPDIQALDGAHQIAARVAVLLGLGSLSETRGSRNEHWPELSPIGMKHVPETNITRMHFRSSLLDSENPLTEPTEDSLQLLQALVLSARHLSRLGMPYTLRRAGELWLSRDKREQKIELMKLIRLAAHHAPRDDDIFWGQLRSDVLWLHSWTPSPATGHATGDAAGVFGTIPLADIEVELLKVILAHSRYALARSIYQDIEEPPLPVESVRQAVFDAALDAFDNASNPNRTRGGLRKCNDILQALPKSAPKSLDTSRQIEALLGAAHSLSNYRLVLKQGEPFSPIMLRVHSDPISILEKVLEQNPKAYTRLQEFIDVGENMVTAGFLSNRWSHRPPSTPDKQDHALWDSNKRVVAMCVAAALREDDFETAYSYIASRVVGSDGGDDRWSWKAALQTGEYVRTPKTQLPTHLGTSSANPEVRHLEQRLECLATALRVAPASELQAILQSFLGCEQRLDDAIAEEAAKEAAWDAAGDLGALPGSFDAPPPNANYPSRNASITTAGRQAEEAPLSIFDLSRATARAARRNLTTLSSLQGMATGGSQGDTASVAEDHHRARRRDQLREAATGTLVSGVGWLIGANVNHSD
ncbi:Sec39 domain-containing protein [Emericellopsis atlantica]|uniref:Sec39 domain-containing protein n=1 Tax=Emericellopsis atlantica TaxID=2614577 RepID=A0A9P8CM69_9HYPO|nr:Sec39 domain-containing protein [Emericellopsis atlantica]KAG9250366.1 Sec39 domain-containing protein [Emericellopsis atlantica]